MASKDEKDQKAAGKKKLSAAFYLDKIVPGKELEPWKQFDNTEAVKNRAVAIAKEKKVDKGRIKFLTKDNTGKATPPKKTAAKKDQGEKPEYKGKSPMTPEVELHEYRKANEELQQARQGQNDMETRHTKERKAAKDRLESALNELKLLDQPSKQLDVYHDRPGHGKSAPGLPRITFELRGKKVLKETDFKDLNEAKQKRIAIAKDLSTKEDKIAPDLIVIYQKNQDGAEKDITDTFNEPVKGIRVRFKHKNKMLCVETVKNIAAIGGKKQVIAKRQNIKDPKEITHEVLKKGEK